MATELTLPRDGIAVNSDAIQPGLNYMPLHVGKIVAVDKARRTADVFLAAGGLLKRVPVLAQVAGTFEGTPYLPNVDAGTGDPNYNRTGRDTYCLVGYAGGDFRKAYVLGLIFPPEFETAFSDAEVNKHANGGYTVWDNDGMEVARPDGTYIRIGGASAKFAGTNVNVKVPFTATDAAIPAPHIFINHSSGLKIDITPAGLIQITKAGGGSFELTTHTHIAPVGGGATGGPQ